MQHAVYFQRGGATVSAFPEILEAGKVGLNFAYLFVLMHFSPYQQMIFKHTIRPKSH